MRRRYRLVGIDRATRWVYVEVLADKSATCAKGFLEHLLKTAALKVTQVLTDNGKESTDRFCATGQREPTDNQLFDQVRIAPKPTVGSSATTLASLRPSPPIVSAPVSTWKKPRYTASIATITTSHTTPSGSPAPWKRCRTGSTRSQVCSTWTLPGFDS